MYEQFADLYQDSGAWGGQQSGLIDELSKALQAGSGAGLSSTGGRALVLEDLEGTLRATTFGEKQFMQTLWYILKARAVEATGIMHEFTQLRGYGETGMFSPEITTSLNPIDVDLGRSYTQVKFARNKRQVSKVMRFTKNQHSPETLQVMAGTRFLISNTERSFYTGDSAMVPDEWDGILKSARANSLVTNMAGAPFTKDAIEQAMLAIGNANGVGSHMFHPLEVQASLDAVLVGNSDRLVLYNGGATPEAIPLGYGGGNNAIMMGVPAAGLRTSFGNLMFRPHIFSNLRKNAYAPLVSGTPTEVATSPTAPATPTTLAAAVASLTGGFAGSGTGGTLTAGKYSGAYAGVYRYRVSSENSAGESIPAAAVTATVTSGQKATLTWDRMTGATCYRVYRSRCGGPAGDEQFIARVADGVSPTYVDGNQYIAGCFKSYVLDLDSPGELATLAWAQLAPMSRDMLPPADTTFQWIQFLFGALAFYAPLKMYVFENVGIY